MYFVLKYVMKTKTFEGGSEESKDYVRHGYIFVKNLAAKKYYIGCHRWREICKETVELKHVYLNFVFSFHFAFFKRNVPTGTK